MTPTSASFVWLIRGLLAVAVVWVLVRWPKAAGRSVWAYLRRLVSLAVVSVLGTLNLLIPVNAEWGWYTTWEDVAGIFSPPQVEAPRSVEGAAARASAETRVGPSPLQGLPTGLRDSFPVRLHKTDVGGTMVVTIPGRISGYTGKATIWFPPSYAKTKGTGRTYPVLETFHGYLPSPTGYFRVFKLDSVISQLSASHTMSEPIVVIPHWAPDNVDTECVDDGVGKLPMETWMTQDVPRWIYQHLRVRPERDSWAALGASAGGWCALMAAMKHPTQYSAAVSMAGYTYPVFDQGYKPFEPSSPLGRGYDLLALAKRKPPAVALWTLTSTKDSMTYGPTTALTAAARAPLSVTPTVLPGGGHRAEVWVPYFPGALTWLASTSRGFAPGAGAVQPGAGDGTRGTSVPPGR